MRKRFCWILCLLLALYCAVAFAADGTTDYVLESSGAKLTLSDSYTVLFPANVSQHPDILTARNTTEEALLADWTARGVQMQAWVEGLDSCLEISALQDEDAEQYFDLTAQTTQQRTAYRSAHMKGTKYKEMGYTIQSAEWAKATGGTRFLLMKYKRDVNGLITRGYLAKTVKNGWTLALDFQVYGRAARESDLNRLKRVLRTVTFEEEIPLPSVTKGSLTFEAVPPTETNVSTFTVEGTTTPGATVIGTLMRYANPTPRQFKAEASARTGKFKMPVKMDSEGVWLLTLTVDMEGTTIAEHVFEPTTYQATLLPLTLDTPVPEQFDSDEFVLSGKTSKAVSIQCIVTGGAKPYDKSVRTNNSGKFTFHIPTDTQSEYSVTLVLQKKNYNTRRMTWTANRTLSEKDIQNQYKAEAVKPAYSTLVRKLENYTGRVMGYKVYITDIQHVGDEYIITAALTRTKKGTLKDLIVIITDTEPSFVVGSEQNFYGRLAGEYDVQSEEDTVKYPSFELLFWE